MIKARLYDIVSRTDKIYLVIFRNSSCVIEENLQKKKKKEEEEEEETNVAVHLGLYVCFSINHSFSTALSKLAKYA
jgi:hypothetical protein